MADLAVAEPGTGPRPRDMDCYQHLFGLDRGRHDVDEKVVRSDAPAAGRACQLQLRFQRDDDCRPVRRRIRICQRAADGAAIAHLRIGNLVGGLMEDRQYLAQRFGRKQFGMRGQCSDPDAVADLDSLQFVDAADIDEQRRRRQPQFQCRDQCMAAGNELGAVGILLQEADGLGQRGCANVIE